MMIGLTESDCYFWLALIPLLLVIQNPAVIFCIPQKINEVIQNMMEIQDLALDSKKEIGNINVGLKYGCCSVIIDFRVFSHLTG